MNSQLLLLVQFSIKWHLIQALKEDYFRLELVFIMVELSVILLVVISITCFIMEGYSLVLL
jgi:hypothetical protein